MEVYVRMNGCVRVCVRACIRSRKLKPANILTTTCSSVFVNFSTHCFLLAHTLPPSLFVFCGFICCPGQRIEKLDQIDEEGNHGKS